MPVGAWSPVGQRAEGGCRAGAAALHRYIIDRWGDGVGSFGCYNPNSRAGTGWSLHREGRAIDVAVGPHVKAKGDGIFWWCVDNADSLGLQEIQWYGQIWTSKRHSEGVRTDTSSARALHYDHIHIGLADGRSFTPPAGAPPAGPQVDWEGFWRYLAMLAAVVRLVTLRRQEDPTMNAHVMFENASHYFTRATDGRLAHIWYAAGKWNAEDVNAAAGQPGYRLKEGATIVARTKELHGTENQIEVGWTGSLGQPGHTWFNMPKWGTELLPTLG